MNEFFSSGRGKWLLTTGMTYIYFFSVLLSTAVTIPLALKYLGREQYGLWAISSQLLSYMFLFDGGLARSLQRLVGEAVHDPNNITAIRRFSLLLALSFLTALLLLAVAVLISVPGLRFLSVPPNLINVGRELFLSIMAVQAVAYLFGPFGAVLFAQNRAYLNGIISILSVWTNAITFVCFLLHGDGLLSYVYGNLLCLPITVVGILFFALRSPGCPKIRFLLPRRGDFHEILSFTGWIFLGTLLAESLAALPTLLITKFAGLGAMAVFYISFRIAFFLQRLAIIPFQSLGPRWQVLHLHGNAEKLNGEFATGVSLTLLSGLTLCCCFMALLKPVVIFWVGGKMYGGTLLTVSLGFYLTVCLLGGVLSTPFILSKRLGPVTIMQLLELILSVPVGAFLAIELGPGGVIAGSVLLAVAFSIGYCWRKSPSALGIKSSVTGLLRKHENGLVLQVILSGLSMAWVWWADVHALRFPQLLLGGGLLAAASILLFVSTTGPTALQMIRQRRAAVPEPVEPFQ